MNVAGQAITEDLSIPAALAGKCIFSVDVEDWFHILDTAAAPGMETWDRLPSIVEPAFLEMLDLFDEKNVRVTCFFLGWIARRYPKLVNEAAKRGHEIASHGYAHRLTFEMTETEFRHDISLARQIIGDAGGCRVLGYRAPGFSHTEDTPWLFDALIESGYEYDSSVFPAARQHGGISGANPAPHRIVRGAGSLVEFPISVADVLGRRACFFGGGYLRLFPYRLIQKMGQRVLRDNRPVVFYVHPREIYPDHPRLAMPLQRRFKSYVNIRGTKSKIRKLLSAFPCVTFQDFLSCQDRAGAQGASPVSALAS